VELEARRREAEAANQAKSTFLATMSHELRTPLNAIGGYAELLEMGIRGPVNEAQRMDLSRIRRAQEHLLSLIGDVLDFAKLEAGRTDFRMEDVSVDALLGEASAMVLPLAGAQGVELRLRPGDPAVAVRADLDKARQIVLNLLSNAVKFTGPGGTVSVEWERGRGMVQVHVHDTGRGIPPDRLAAIFEPFVQVEDGLTRTVQGSGLGLAISRELARGMGGGLVVRSAEGRGSTFTLCLPLAPGRKRER
jgi:signal transduction histidine kinase